MALWNAIGERIPKLCSDRFSFECDTFGRGQLGLGHVILTIGSLLNIPLLTKITQNNFFIGTWIQIDSDRTRRADSNEPTFRVSLPVDRSPGSNSSVNLRPY